MDNKLTPYFVRTLQGKTIMIEISPTKTIYEFKKLIHKDIHPDDIRLIWMGRQLQDDYTLNDYKIPADATIHHVERLRGD